MAASNWLDEHNKSLSRHRLPTKYKKRFMDELLDHFLDLKEENPEMDTTELAGRLGDPDHLATIAAAELRRGTFAGRHPIFTFVVVPIPMVTATIVAVMLVLWSVVWLVPEEAMHSPQGIAITSVFLATISWTLRLLPFALATVMFLSLAARTGRGWRWSVTATLLVALFAGIFSVWYQEPAASSDNWRFGLGLAIPPGQMQLLQLSVPLAIAGWYAWRGSQSRRLIVG